VVGLLAVGAGAFAVWSAFFATGPQPAEALPDSTIGYVSIDLDPSGKQKLEALEALKKFPAFEDAVELNTDDDLRLRLFELAQDDGVCNDLDFGDDVEPWLGNRFALAAVDLGKQDDEGNAVPTVVGVIQVEDSDAAEEGFAKLRDCADSSVSGDEDRSESEMGGWFIEGEWAVIAETEELAQEVSDAAQESPLSEDDDFQKWTDEAGDPGILTAYASPAAGDFLVDAVAGVETDEMRAVFEGFEGAAVTVRFDDGALEVEAASSTDYLGLDSIAATDRGDDVLATLPADTAIALGLGFEEGWFNEVVDYASNFSGGLFDIDEAIAEVEDETGMSLPEDAETVTGESAAISIGSDFDPLAFEDGADPDELPIGLKIKGDPDAIAGVLDKVLEQVDASNEILDAFGYASEGDYVVAGLSDDYTEQLIDDGELGDSEVYQDVVRESENASSVLFVNFDAGDWLVEVAQDDDELRENLEPLSALGISVWTDDDVSHSVLRITTE